MTRILLVGILGRMGREITALAEASDELKIVCGIDTEEQNFQGIPVYKDFSSVKEDYDVLIDFSSPQLADELLAYLEKVRKPAVLCTTGLSTEQEAVLEKQASLYPTFRSANMSVGVYVLSVLAAKANELLGAAFDCEISESHHRGKKDAPSGTAFMLAKAVQDSSPDERPLCLDRSSRHEARKDREIGMQALRMGGVAGDHTVYFASDSEIISLSHHAESRRVFASGALRAALFIQDKDPDLYNMSDMLGL